MPATRQITYEFGFWRAPGYTTPSLLKET